MASVSTNGKVAPSTKETGSMIKPMVKAYFGTVEVTFISVNSNLTKPLAMVSTFIAVVPVTKESGSMITKKAKVKKTGKTVPPMLVAIRKE